MEVHPAVKAWLQSLPKVSLRRLSG